jgi:hypothetical protein
LLSLILLSKYTKFDNGALKLPSNFAISTSFGGIDASFVTFSASNISP